MFKIIIPDRVEDATVQKKIIIEENIKSLEKDVNIIITNYPQNQWTSQQKLKIEMLQHFYAILDQLFKKYEVKNATKN